MELIFDRGTIRIEDLDVWDAEAGLLPECFVWDPRVDRFRAPAVHLHAFLRWLEERDLSICYHSGRPQDFRPEPCSPDHLPGLRPYQEAALRDWSAVRGRGLLELPTGSGKTRLAVRAILEGGAPALVLVPTRQLLHQWKIVLAGFYPGEIGLWGDGEHVLKPITLATYDGARMGIERFGDHFDLLVVDEAHHLAGELLDTVQMSTAARRLGLSATYPEAPEWQARVEPVFGPICHSLPILALAGTHLARFEIRIVAVHLGADEQAAYDRSRAVFQAQFRPFREAFPNSGWADFVRCAARSCDGREALAALRKSQGILALPQAKILALDRLLDLHRRESKLVFTADNRSAYEVSRRFLVPAITCDTARSEREDLLAGFRDGRYRTLVSAKVLNEGLDVPEASVAIVAGGGPDPLEHAQRIGRTLRPLEGKKALIYELVCVGTQEWRTSERRMRSHVLSAASPV